MGSKGLPGGLESPVVVDVILGLVSLCVLVVVRCAGFAAMRAISKIHAGFFFS